jgi:two-component system KDP operon response regulator KdpE
MRFAGSVTEAAQSSDLLGAAVGVEDGHVTRVLVVEDEVGLLRALAMNLTARGYDVVEADTGTKALTAAAVAKPDVILLDLGLPDLGGMEVIRGVRAYSATPIVVLSARTGSSDKVTALDFGADDYVTKPFSIDELLARLRAATRRASAIEAGETALVRIGSSTVDLDAKIVTGADGKRVHLTPTEWHLLEVLLHQPGKLVTSRTLLTELRGTPEHTDPSYLRIYIAQLRRKLEAEPSRPRHLITEPGMGYRFQP